MEPREEIVKSIADEAGKMVADQGLRELVVRTGSALPPHDPIKINISGGIDAPFRWLVKRRDIICQLQCHIIVNRWNMTVELFVNEKKFDFTYIKGSLELAPEFKRFGINNPDIRMSCFEMADLIKMNRSFFETRNDAMLLVSELRNFKAKVDKAIEQSDDRRGNTTMIRNQAVESNIPSEFKLLVPVFRGHGVVPLSVEVDIDPNDLSCALVSPEAADYIEAERSKIISNTLGDIAQICPDIVVIEQ